MNVKHKQSQRGNRHLGMMAAMLGRRANVRVCFDTNGGAHTNGKEIHLPEFEVPLGDAEAAIVEGLFDHELAHCRFTDFSYLNSPICSARQRKNGPLHFPILNALEDVWIEREQAEIYPGCARAIARATELAIDRGHIIGQRPVKSNAEALLVMIACGLIGKQSRIERLVAIGDKAKAQLSKAIGADLTTRVWELACARIPACKTTVAADDLADEILTLVASAVPPERERDAKSGQKGDEADAQGPRGNGTEAQTEATREMLKDATATYSDIADQLCESLKQSDATKPTATGRGANWSETETPIELAAHQVPVQRDFAASSRSIVAKLGVRLESLLEAKTEECTSISRTGREIFPGRLVNLRFGETNVFRRFEDAEGLDTAVSVLIDLSQSMFNPAKVDASAEAMAKNAAFAVLQVLERFDVPTELYAFGARSVRVKSFEQSWRSQKAFIDVKSLGGTATERAVFSAAMSLATRQEARRLLILVTDGEPAGVAASTAAISELKSWGIESANLFLGNEGKVFEHELRGQGFHVERCLRIDELPTAIFKAVQNSF